MRFICYSAALCFQSNRFFKVIDFSPKGRRKIRQYFEIFYILDKINIFLSVFITKIIISDLTINIRSTVLKNGVFRSV